jgi:hypothetical protein
MSQTHALPIAVAPARRPVLDRVLAVAAVLLAAVALVVAFVAMRDEPTAATPRTPTPAQPWNVPDCPLHGRC